VKPVAVGVAVGRAGCGALDGGAIETERALSAARRL
jgi:hypothetical protein